MPEGSISVQQSLPFFRAEEADQFSFFRIPKVLFTSDLFRNMSTDAKLLYGILLDRMSLSVKNNWIDEKGHAYIFFSIESVQENLACGKNKAVNLMKELDEAGLIGRKKQFQNRPDIIYVKKFLAGAAKQNSMETPENSGGLKSKPPEVSKPNRREFENQTSGSWESKPPGIWKSNPNNTEKNNTEMSEIYPIVSGEGGNTFDRQGGCDGYDAIQEQEKLQAYFRKTLNYERLLMEYPFDHELIDEIIAMLTDICASSVKTIRISGEDKPAAIVKSRFMKLRMEHITYVMKCMGENGTKVRNIRQYLLTALYNAPMTMGHFFRAWVNHDMAEGMTQYSF